MNTALRLLLMGGRIPGVYNFTPSNLRNWRIAAEATRAGTGRAKLALVGDSTTRGMGSGTVDLFENTEANSYPSQLAALLTAGGLPAQSNSFVCNGRDVTSLANSDPRVSYGVGWAASAVESLGGYMMVGTTADSAFAFEPTASVDTFEIFYAINSSLGSANVAINGGATLATLNGAGVKAVGKSTVIATGGTNEVQLTWTSGVAGFYVIGMDSYLSTTKQVSVLNMGSSGGTVGTTVGNPVQWGAEFVMPSFAPHLTVISLTINDAKLATALSTFKTSVQTLITLAKTTGDCVLMIGAPSKVTSISAASQRAYAQAYYDLADVNDVPLIDLPKIFVAQETAALSGCYYDALHPSKTGYAQIAETVARVLLAAS